MIVVDRISPLTVLLDDVLYKSAIADMRRSYFFATKNEQAWLLLSDYYFGDQKPNKVITFSAMPACPYVPELQDAIKAVAPRDIKNTRSINADFVRLINLLPLINIVFLFENKKHFIWDTTAEATAAMLDHVEILRAYVEYWRTNEPASRPRLKRITRNLDDLESLLKRGKKLRIISAMFLVAILGGYVGSLIARETDLSTLIWLSDRDSTNEIGKNLIRDLFQITLIDVIKKNINFSFTSSNSNCDEWYKEVTRIPDYITGAAAGFDFTQTRAVDEKTTQMLGLHFRNNRSNTFLFRFKVDDERIRLQRMLITNKEGRA
jgi:hypothetical protein